jgi:hypothetical protein
LLNEFKVSFILNSKALLIIKCFLELVSDLIFIVLGSYLRNLGLLLRPLQLRMVTSSDFIKFIFTKV